jgi:hypothetical protein
MQLMPAGNWLTVNQVPSTHSISKLVSELQDSGRLPRTCPPASKLAKLLQQPTQVAHRALQDVRRGGVPQRDMYLAVTGTGGACDSQVLDID